MARHATPVRLAMLATVCAVALVGTVPAASGDPGTTTRIEVAGSTLLVENPSIPSLSADGSRILFSAYAMDSASGFAGNQLLVQERTDGSTTVVCVASDGTWADSGCHEGVISGNGRFVAFVSEASSLVPDDPQDACPDDEPCRNVFRHDLVTGVTESVSVPLSGPYDLGNSYAPDISADGNYVVFESNSPNLVAGDLSGDRDIFVRDMAGGTTTRVSVPAPGVEPNGVSIQPSISADGEWVAFASTASNFAGDPGLTTDIFVANRLTGDVEGLGYGNSGPTTKESYNPSISGDGDRVVFSSQATNLDPRDTLTNWSGFVYDRSADAVELVDVRSDGTKPAWTGASTDRLDITTDGRFVAFRSTNKLLTDGGGCCLFLRDLDSGVTTMEGVNSLGQPPTVWNADTGIQDLVSDDGRFVAFSVRSNDVFPGAGPDTYSVYVHDRGADTGEVASGYGSVTTDSEADGATVFDPLEVTVTSAQPGLIDVSEVSPATQVLPGRYESIGQELDISAPVASPGAPLILRFLLDGSIVPPSIDLSSIGVFRNGVLVDNCLDPSQPDPTPCVVSRTRLPGRDVEIVVHTLQASAWNVAVDPTAPPGDSTAPTVTIHQPADGESYPLGSNIVVDFSCADDHALTSCVGDQPVGTVLNSGQVGLQTFGVQAIDAAGNTTTGSSTFRVVYPFDGFFSPVDVGAVNLAKAGQTVPVKWQLRSSAVTVSDPSSFVSLSSRVVSCSTFTLDPLDPIETYSNAAGLLYQGSGNWQLNWKTPKSFSGQCRTMVLKLADGTVYEADFQFR